MSQLWDYMLARQGAMTRTLEQWVMLESPSNEQEAVNALGDLVGLAFKRAGAVVERLPQAAFGDHLRISWGQGDCQLLVLGHMDTVWPLGEVQRRPFRLSQGKATGPGAFDMKGGLVVALYTVMALQELGLKPAPPSSIPVQFGRRGRESDVPAVHRKGGAAQ